MKRRTRILGVMGALALALTASAGSWFVAPLVRTAVSYKAKMVCSGLYVAGLDLPEVLTDLSIDDLAVLKWISVVVDGRAESVTASAFGLARRHATNRPGLGCSLALRDQRPIEFMAHIANAHLSAYPFEAESTSAALKTVLDSAFTEADSQRRKRTRAVVVLHHGRIVAEQYSGPGVGSDTRLPGWSMTKSVLNALVGILVGQGRLELNTPVAIPEWNDSGDERRRITLDHLLRMSSGLRFDEGMSGARSDVMQMLFGSAGAADYAVARPLQAPPGTVWQYSSGNSNVIAQAMRTVLRAEYHAFPRTALFDPVGMPSAVLEIDATGTFVGSSYMYATARDWARFGQLYLQDGVWDRQRILPAGWVSYSVTPAPADSTSSYGAHFWLDVPGEYRHSEGHLPADAFHAVGHEGQFVTIIPSQDVVIVRFGRTRYPDAWDHEHFVRAILDALSTA